MCVCIFCLAQSVASLRLRESLVGGKVCVRLQESNKGFMEGCPLNVGVPVQESVSQDMCYVQWEALTVA